jgi:hypothetical protein
MVRLVCTPQTLLLLPMGRTGVPWMPEQFSDPPFETGHSIWASVYVAMMYGWFDVYQGIQWCYCGISKKKVHIHPRPLAILYETRRAASPTDLQAVHHPALIQALFSAFLACNQPVIRGHRPRSPSARTAKLPSWKHNWTFSIHVPNDIVCLSAYPSDVGSAAYVWATCGIAAARTTGIDVVEVDV